MNVNKKFNRFKQWAGERMGQEVQTDTSEDFKALEVEMQLRHEGMEKMQRSMKNHTKHLNGACEGDLGSTMVAHGSDFEPDSEFGMCLTAMGRANERIARLQAAYAANATSSWLESVERSVVQMKEYQTSRKRLEQRRLAYDTTLGKIQKAKKEDYRVEEELRSQKAKYEDSSEEVYRRMQDIKEAEVDSVVDLTAFLDAELEYYEQCREVLLRLREEWPASTGGASSSYQRSRSNTAHSYAERIQQADEPPMPELRPTISSNHSFASNRGPSPLRYDSPEPPPRPTATKSSTFDIRSSSPAARSLSRTPSEPPNLVNRPQLRPVARDPYGQYDTGSPAPSIGRDRSVSPATSHGSSTSRTASAAIHEANSAIAATRGKPAPPPPPPSRSLAGKKAPPPPPPTKRSNLG